MDSPRSIRAVACLATLLVSVCVRAENAESPPPLDPGLGEGVESRLVQFEVRVTRKGVPVPGLGAKDLAIELGGKPLAAFTVDDMCVAAAAPAVGAPAARPGSFVFYFDEPELTMDGRHRAIEVARLVAPALLAQGHNVLILRNGAALRAETKWTRDAAEVTAALDRIAADPGHRDFLQAASEEAQAERLLAQAETLARESEMDRVLSMDDTQSRLDNSLPSDSNTKKKPVGRPAAAGSAARKEASVYKARGDAAVSGLVGEFQTVVEDELRRNGRDIERLRGAVRSLALRSAPKGVVYFADTLRRDPGGVVARAMASVPELTNRGAGAGSLLGVASWNSDAALAALVRDASAHGVRFYAVEGRGLLASSDWVRTSQDTLSGIAQETGGLAFVNGIAAEAIAASVAVDQACWYLVSFDPNGWEEERRLPILVSAKQAGLRVKTRPSLVIPSKATIAESRLLAAHFGDPVFDEQPLSVSLYPVGGTSKRLEVLAQVRLPEGLVPQARDASWDVAVEVVSQGAVVAHASYRVAWSGNGQPPVCQTTLALPPGPYEVVAVARESASDSIREGRLTGTWPAFSARHVALSLPALAQPQKGGIVKEGEVRASGVVVRGAGNLVDPRAPSAIVTAACLEGSKDVVLRAERSIVGETEVKFAPTLLTPDEGRCVQIRDLVAAGTFGAGRLTYHVTVFAGDDAIASQQLSFDVAEVAPPPAAP